MALDGEKLRNLRAAKGMSQEKLAILANVNKRTIQRAEKGDSVGLETAAFIAEAVGVSAASLRGRQPDLFDVDKKEWDEVVLVPVNSGRRVIDALRSSHDAEISFDVEPTQDNIEPLAKLAGMLEPFNPNPWENPHERYEPAQAEVLQKQADVNTLLPSLLEMGINVYLGTYQAGRQIPSYDMHEGMMSRRVRAPIESVPVSLVVVSDTSSSHLLRKPDDVYTEPKGDGVDLEDDIPF
ncbi:helix-turn-helix protein [Rhodobiaceae bacterium]|nr:helix-turn-helix protein [Rhodobiaceae bacterium]